MQEARQKVAEILAEAEAQDQADDQQYGPDHSGNELPEELKDAKERVARTEQILTQAGENAKETLRVSPYRPAGHVLCTARMVQFRHSMVNWP